MITYFFFILFMNSFSFFSPIFNLFFCYLYVSSSSSLFIIDFLIYFFICSFTYLFIQAFFYYLYDVEYRVTFFLNNFVHNFYNIYQPCLEDVYRRDRPTCCCALVLSGTVEILTGTSIITRIYQSCTILSSTLLLTY